MKLTVSFFAFVAILSMLVADDKTKTDTNTPDRPVELGLVQWNRDLAAATKRSSETGKPIFMLFQEVPGCQTCQDFGNSPMSHPLLVEAIEDLFVPVLVYNNKKEDETTLKRFKEPAWNNPVVRYLDSDHSDLIQREQNVWTTTATAKRMIAALNAAGKTAPEFLQLVAEVDNKAPTETAEFAMHCYWEGEAKLGAIQGVKATQSGWRGDLEVVQVEFDPAVVQYEKLLKTAQTFDCASKVFTHNEMQQSIATQTVGEKSVAVKEKMKVAKLSDQKYYVRNAAYAHLPLTALQATKINGALYNKQSPEKWLSPRQKQMLEVIVAAKAKDKTAFADFVWPDDDAKLVVYQERLRGELIQRNLVWDPGWRVPIALVGDFDIDNDGNSDRQKIIDLIKKNGGRVVGYHDEAGAIVGEIDASTRYVVVGNLAGERPATAKQATKKLLDQAKAHSVQQIDVNKLLNWMGQAKVERLDGDIGEEFRKRHPAKTLESKVDRSEKEKSRDR